jgi:hypothetical protein
MRNVVKKTRILFAGLLLSRGLAFSAQINVTCTNSTGDAATLNTAISTSKPGDQIQIHGTCLLNQTIVLYGDRTYEGDSRTGTILRQASATNLNALVASDSWINNSASTGDPVRVAHLTIDGNAGSNSGTTALIIRSWLTVLEDLLIEYAPEDGLRITSLSENGTALTNTQVNGHISNIFVTNSGGDGVHVVDPSGTSVTDWSLLDSWVAYSRGSAIYMQNAAGWTIRGNHVYGIRKDAIYANACWATTIDGNYIEGFGGEGGKHTWYGIACLPGGGAASVVSANKVFMFQKEPPSGNFDFIAIPQVDYGIGIVNVVDNVILGVNGQHDTGLSYQINGGAGLEVLSRGNSVEAVHTRRSVGTGVNLLDGY